MSYYNYPETYIHAKIASETSILMSNIQIQQGVISQLQTVLVTTNDLSNNPIDLSNNDLSNNPIDLSNNQ